MTLELLESQTYEAIAVDDRNFILNAYSGNGTVIGNLEADSPPGLTLGYSILSGNSNNYFGLDSGTGELTLEDNSNIDPDVTPQYDLSVEVDDGVLAATITVSILVRDTIYTVASSGADYTSIEDALADAYDGVYIFIADETFTENGLDIEHNITIRGEGMENTIIQGAGAPETASNRIFTIDAFKNVTIEDLTVRHGVGNPSGGGILTYGNLTLNDCKVSDNYANSKDSYQGGGGIANYGVLEINNSIISDNENFDHLGGGILNGSNLATLVIENSSVNNNVSGGSAGGIANAWFNEVEIYNSTISGNIAIKNAGGIHSGGNSEGTILIENSTVSNNESGQYGGRVYNGNSTWTILNSTIANNISVEYGGGIYNNDEMTITNSTITKNLVVEYGGGIYNGDTVSILNSTIAYNTTEIEGGGIYDDGSSVAIKNTILASNVDTSTNYPDFYGDIVSMGYNLIGSAGSNYFTSNTTGDIYGDPRDSVTVNTGATEENSIIDAKLDSLKDNGGETYTIALYEESLAIDGGTTTDAPTTDQRGSARTGSDPEIGSFEMQLATATVSSVAADGFNVTLSPAINGLVESNFTLDNSATINDATTSNSGQSYSIDVMLTTGVTYTLDVNAPG